MNVSVNYPSKIVNVLLVERPTFVIRGQFVWQTFNNPFLGVSVGSYPTI